MIILQKIIYVIKAIIQLGELDIELLFCLAKNGSKTSMMLERNNYACPHCSSETSGTMTEYGHKTGSLFNKRDSLHCDIRRIRYM